MINKNEIVQLIKEAFNNIPYPGDDNIVYENQYDENYEGNQMAKFFRGKRWQQITLKSLQNEYRCDGSSCLCFMSPQSFKYYLPAYMIIAVEKYEEADAIGDSAIYALSPPQDNDLIESWTQNISGFSEKQREAIVEFLQFMHENYKIDDDSLIQALTYWHKNT